MAAPAPAAPPVPDVALVSIEMGYGHMRAAKALASHFNTDILHVDREPLASTAEAKRWHRSRSFYEKTSRASSLPLVGAPFKALLDSMTHIPPLSPYRNQSAPNLGTQLLERLVRGGMGKSMSRYLRDSELPLLTTFYAPAIVADRLGIERVYCVVTDTDIHRIWASVKPETSAVRYLVPSQQAARRLRAYGVRSDHIHFTGFPLPPELIGGVDAPVLKTDLRNRLGRLDRRGTFRRQSGSELTPVLGELPPETDGPPHLVFAVGGAGAQANMIEQFLPSLRSLISDGMLQVTLVAGIREEVRAYFESRLNQLGLSGRVEVLHEPNLDLYFPSFNALLRRTDILWTKPSEMTFFGGLGIPLIFSPAVGVHEQYNRRWAVERGAGLEQHEPRHAGEWLSELLDEGTLASAAWNGFKRLPKHGTYRIAEVISGTHLYLEADL